MFCNTKRIAHHTRVTAAPAHHRTRTHALPLIISIAPREDTRARSPNVVEFVCVGRSQAQRGRERERSDQITPAFFGCTFLGAFLFVTIKVCVVQGCVKGRKRVSGKERALHGDAAARRREGGGAEQYNGTHARTAHDPILSRRR